MRLSKGIHLPSLIALAVVCYCIFFYGLGRYPLWDPDEGRVGEIAKEMVASGNWATLTHNGLPYYDKPAPYFWLLALGIKLLGLNELAVRLPSALAAGLTIGLVYLWGCVSGGWKRGLWGGLVLATSIEFAALGRFAKMDMLFTFFFSAALFCFLWWRKHGSPKRSIWPFYLALALASLTKGPAGVLLPLLIVGITLGLEKKWAFWWQMRLLQGIVIFALVSGAWYLPAAVYDLEYIKTFLWDHNVLRFITSEPGINHPKPFYYLSLVLIGGFLPWSFFLPPVLHGLWESKEPKGQEERLFLMVWVVTVLVFFSLSRNKLGTYILPVFPPLALLTGDFLRQFVEGKETRLWRHRWVLYGSFVWLLLLFAFSPVSKMILEDRYPQYFSLLPPVLPSALLVGFAVVGWALRKGNWVPWVVSVSSLWFVLWFYGVKVQEISEFRSTQTLAQIVNRSAAKGVRVVAIRAESFPFYLSGPVQKISNLGAVERMLQEPTPTIALIKTKHLRQMHQLPPAGFFVWKSIPSARALVANFPLPPAQKLGKVPKY